MQLFESKKEIPKPKVETKITTKIVLIGLPGTGKTTTLKNIMQIFHDMFNQVCEYQKLDKIINERLTMKDDTFKKFIEDNELTLPPEYESIINPIERNAALFNAIGESHFRDLEEEFNLELITIYSDAIDQEKQNIFLDLGGRAPLRQKVKELLKEKGFILVYLEADQEIIMKHLSRQDNWKTRGMYLNAGVNGWKELALQYRTERTPLYESTADIKVTLSDEDKPFDVASKVIQSCIEYIEMQPIQDRKCTFKL